MQSMGYLPTQAPGSLSGLLASGASQEKAKDKAKKLKKKEKAKEKAKAQVDADFKKALLAAVHGKRELSPSSSATPQPEPKMLKVSTTVSGGYEPPDSCELVTLIKIPTFVLN